MSVEHCTTGLYMYATRTGPENVNRRFTYDSEPLTHYQWSRFHHSNNKQFLMYAEEMPIHGFKARVPRYNDVPDWWRGKGVHNDSDWDGAGIRVWYTRWA